MQAHCSLDKALAAGFPVGVLLYPPQVFPDLMGLKVLTAIKEEAALLEEVV